MEPLATGLGPDTLLIRPATGYDEATVYAFLCELEKEELDRSAFQAVFQRNLSADDIHYVVAEREGSVIGFVSCHVQYLLHHVGKVGEIQELFVQAPYRNQRVGHQLLAALDVMALELGLVNLEVTTNRIRVDTHRFYAQSGFQQTHVKFVKNYGFSV